MNVYKELKMSNEKSPRIIGILATKDRPDFFKRALASAANQKRKPDAVIVVSDSTDDNYRLEKQIAEECGFEIVRDTREHNYAGSLNSAIHHYVRSRRLAVGEFAETYVAFLDDDDEWLLGYIEKCEAALNQNNADFVVCGLRYKDENGAKELSIPQELTLEDFLRGNPHIQGSNTFIRLSVLMGAGLFDENMSSTTDRDLFVRVMMQNPTYAIVNEHLVEIDACGGRKRITNSREIKVDGLRKFYYKYRALMDEKTRSDFFKRAADRFGAGEEEITKIAEKRLNVGERFSSKRFEGRLVAGFIATEIELGMRLLHELAALDVAKLKVVILYNAASGSENYEAFLRSKEIDFALRKSSEIVFDDFRDALEPSMAKSLGKEKIEDIAVSRSILQKLLWQNSEDGDAIWILDDDMELCELVAKDGKVEEVPLDMGRVIATYAGGEYDAVVGRYSLDAPLPMLSTLRCSLLDLAYSRLGFDAQGKLPPLGTLGDCYYDLSDAGAKHLETPFSMQEGIGLDEIFSGKTNRRLFVADGEVRDVKSRGGNTLVFNREILKVPNWSLEVKDKIARRGDFFWILKAKAEGFKIADVPFATKHNRGKTAFNFVKERGKLLRDLIGSSFTKAVEEVGMDAKCEDFYKAYQSKFEERLTKFVCSFFRIQALLKMLGDKKYLADFSCANLAYFVKLCKEYMDKESIEAACKKMRESLAMNQDLQRKDEIQQKLAEYLGISKGDLRLLGNGGEAVIFTDKEFVYKCFFTPLQNKEFLKKISLNFGECEQLYPIELLSVSTLDVIKYRFEKSSPYEGGHARDLASFLRFAKEHGFAFDNIKKSNFIVASGKLKMIDFGKSFIPFEAEKFKTSSVMRAYQMFRYPTLSEDDFKRMIFRSYTDERTFLSDGWQNLDALVQRRHKEALHDDIVLTLAQKHKSAKILDYGAGHCRIANALSLLPNREVCVYDIDMETIQKRAGEKVSILSETASLEDGTFDLILNNLVLCCIDEETAESVVQEISRLLKLGGQVIFSICNPFFNSVQNTELRTTGLQGNYRIAERFIKKTTIGTPKRDEFHRPIEFYENLFSRYGVEIESVLEGRGVNTDNLLPIAEHIIFDCKKVEGVARIPQQHLRKATAELVVYIRGFNTPCDKLKRLFDSLKAQTFSDFEVVYIDDASENEGADYARFMLKNDSFFKERTIAFFNDTNTGELANFVFAMQNVIVKAESIVVNVDNDDYLVNPRALEIIKERFDRGAELTCGNCIRYDNPLKKYELVSFDRVWERGGDNIWVHPKCFRRKLFDSIDVESDLKIDGKFVDVNTDFAIMLPMVAATEKREFISEVLYYFEPSADNANKVGKYSGEYKTKVKQELLENAKKKSHRGDWRREGRA